MVRLLFFISLLTCLKVDAQQLTVSEEIPLNSDLSYDVLGQLGGHILLFRNGKTQFHIQAFNTQLRESWMKELELDKRLPNVLGIVPTQEDFTLVYSFRQRGNTIIKAHRYDPAANLQDSATLVNLGYLFFTPRFELVRSEDRSKLLIHYSENQDVIRSYAFDLPTQALLWEKAFTPEEFIYDRDFVQATIDNKGQAHFILAKDNFRSRRKQHYYQIYSYNGSGEPIGQNIPLEKLTFDVFFKADNLNNQLIAAGLYSDENLERAEGYFYLKYQPGSETDPVPLFTPFSEAFLENLLGKEYREGKGLSETSVRDIVLRRDGGALLVAERNRQLQRRTGMTNRAFADPTVMNLVDFYFEEVFVLSIHPDGALHWETILHKRQYSQDDNGIFSSYFMFETPGRLRFLFNDEIKHENTVSEYVINGLGEYDRNSLFNTTNLDLRLRFRSAVQINSQELIIPSERKNRLRLVRLRY
ncbi:MAG: hypothetical protein R2795_00395 [Saprospiraceae bacterium]